MKPNTNDPVLIKTWVYQTIQASTLGTNEQRALIKIGCAAVDTGCLRGDVSDLWQGRGYSQEDIPGMCV